MPTYEREETIVLARTITDADKALADPSVSITVTVTDPDDTVVVDAEAMTKISTGIYNYDYTPGAAAVVGTYQVEYTAIDGDPARTTITYDEFTLRARIPREAAAETTTTPALVAAVTLLARVETAISARLEGRAIDGYSMPGGMNLRYTPLLELYSLREKLRREVAAANRSTFHYADTSGRVF